MTVYELFLRDLQTVTNSEKLVREHFRTIQSCDIYGWSSRTSSKLLRHLGIPKFWLMLRGCCYTRQNCYCNRKQRNSWNCKSGLETALLDSKGRHGCCWELQHPWATLFPAAPAGVTRQKMFSLRRHGQRLQCIHISALLLHLSEKNMPSDARTGKRLSCRFRSTRPSESILECSESHGMMAQQPALSQECSCCTWTCPTGEQVTPSVALHSFSCILYCPHWCLLHSITPCCADTAPRFWYTWMSLRCTEESRC